MRGCMLTYTGLAVTDFPEEDFPVPRTVYRPFHLDASAGKLLDTAPTKKGEITYPSDEFAGKACFTFTADRRIDIFGMIKVKFWTSYDTGADADYHCIIRKLDTRGKTLRHNNIPYKDLPLNVQSDYDLLEFSVAVHNGPNAHLRASYRATDTSRKWHACGGGEEHQTRDLGLRRRSETVPQIENQRRQSHCVHRPSLSGRSDPSYNLKRHGTISDDVT